MLARPENKRKEYKKTMRRFFSTFFKTIGFLVTFAILAVIALVYFGAHKQTKLPQSAVLMLNFSGELAEVSSNDVIERLLGYSGESLKDVVDAIDAASQDDRIHGIVACIDGSGLGIAQAQEIRDAIVRFRAEGRNKGKFAIAYSETFGELGPGLVPYYLASIFDEVWMQPMGLLGVTGLFMEIPFAKKAVDEWKIKPQFGKREQYKSLMDSLTESDFTEANKEESLALMKSLFNQVVRDVAMSRELTEAEVGQIINQGPLLGDEAKKTGLIDRLAYFDELEQYLSERIGMDPEFVGPLRYLSTLPPLTPGLPKIALISGGGVIQRSAQSDMFGEMVMSSEALVDAFEEATDDADVKAIVFRINSGGGSAIASETIWRATVLAQEAGKPVIVSMSDAAASGGYWVAASADKIVAHPGTITGSIGVIGGKIVTNGLWEKFGVHWGTLQIGENASMWSNVKEYTPQGWQRLQIWLDEVYSKFIDKIAKGRELSVDHVRSIAKGRVWTGEDALKLGLVDALGDLKSAIDLAKAAVDLADEEVNIQIYPKQKSFFTRLMGSFYGKGDIGVMLFSSLMRSSAMAPLKEVYQRLRPLVRSPETLSTPHQLKPKG